MTEQIASKNVCFSIVEALAEAEGVGPLDLGYSLNEYIDPALIEDLAAHEGSKWVLQFPVSGHAVTVESDGPITVDVRSG